ncbi:hypothetical protein AMAG_08410 [Allomyces macrogynus ATCC 38327]|uniref:Uncharacterized protein n=1 Tax=Allomyces macrogynus (strain ATCC 38327) TaxID=578462 RepID=A0A0L0SL23_ALLM3|nr:hypothetical protein AMAG_08410 [Allomyces macrogynus ATCC 38327]|eukprot:KNE63266.1 hypothetical protein AMAG_08410 [Allomyces macrogynus ATCC 38327]
MITATVTPAAHGHHDDSDFPQPAAPAAVLLHPHAMPPPRPAAGAAAASAAAPSAGVVPADDPLAELLGILAPPHITTTSDGRSTNKVSPPRRAHAGDRPSSDLASAPAASVEDLRFAFETTPALDKDDHEEEAMAVDDNAVPVSLLPPPPPQPPQSPVACAHQSETAAAGSARPAVAAAPAAAPAPAPAPAPAASDTMSNGDDTEYEVSTLASRRPLVRRGKYLGFEYEVVWSDGSRTWEPETNLSGCAALLADFEERERKERERTVVKITSRRKPPSTGGRRGRNAVEYRVEWTDGTESWEPDDALGAAAHDLIAAFEAARVMPAHGDRSVPPRRSTRVTRNSARTRSPTSPPAAPAADQDLDRDEDTAASYDLSSIDDDDDDDDEDSDYGASRRRRPTTRSARKSATVAVQAVSSTTVDRRLRTAPHAAACFACARGDELEKMKPRRAVGRKRRDEFSDSDDEAPRGKLRTCVRCTAAYHHVCVPRKADKRGRATIALVDEGTKFVCPHCEQDAEADARKGASAGDAPMAEASASTTDLAPDTPATATSAKPVTLRDLLFPATNAPAENADQPNPPTSDHVCPYCPLTPPGARAVQVPTDLRFRCRTCHVAMHWACAGAHLGVGLCPFHWNPSSPAPTVPDPVPATAATLTALLDRGQCGACRACPAHGIDRFVTHRDAQPFREILVKWAGASYRHARWVPEPTLRGIQGRKLDMYLRRVANRAAPSAKDAVPRAWTQVHKVLAMDDDGHVLVKWRELPPEHATWEDVEDMDMDEDADYLCAVVAYQCAAEIDTVAMRHDRAATNGGDDDVRPNAAVRATGLPKGMAGGTLKPHQVTGVQWLLDRWAARTPCILADEMGLGKTVQVLAVLHVLLTNYQRSPFLIVAPNSTLDHWERECARWAPALTVVTAWGTAADRKVVLDHELLAESMKRGTGTARAGRGGGAGAARRSGGGGGGGNEVSLKCHVVLASYESVQQMPELARVRWAGVIVDEGHKLKNDEAKLFAYLAAMHADHRVLLSGTPLQNSVRELVNLLHFLDPTEFPDPAALADEFNVLDEADATARAAKVRALHAILRPRLLRRTKDDVDLRLPPRRDQVVAVRMSPLQRELVRDIYSSNFELLTALGVQAAAAATGTGTTVSAGSVVRSASLQNIVMQCRKVLSHPFTLPAVEQGLPATTNAHVRLVESAGKLALLDRILPRLQAGGHKLLIFAQFMSTLDILEDYLIGCKLAKPFSYYRLDGDTPRPQRQDRIDKFNTDPGALVFLLSTRAGGVGVTLTAADTVIVYDLDWNPHWDAQAIARAHRIGQTRPVLALRFVTAQSVEERMAAVAHRKLALDHAVVQAMRGGGKSDDENHDEDLLKDVVQYGARAAFAADNEEAKDATVGVYADEEIDRMLDRTALDNNNYVDDTDRPNSTTSDAAAAAARPATPADSAGDDAEWTAVLARVRAVADAAARRDAAVLAQGRRRRRTTTQSGPAFDDALDDGDGEYVPPAADAGGEVEDIDEDEVGAGEGVAAEMVADLGGTGLMAGAAADPVAHGPALGVGGDENVRMVPPLQPAATVKDGDKAPRKRKRKGTAAAPATDDGGAKANGEGKKRRRKTATADGTAGKADGEGKKRRQTPVPLVLSAAHDVHPSRPPTQPQLPQWPARAKSVPPPTAAPLAPAVPVKYAAADPVPPMPMFAPTGRARAHTTGSDIPISAAAAAAASAYPHTVPTWLAPALSAPTAAPLSPAVRRRRAATAAHGYRCWICAGSSMYATAAHHLPTQCAALTDRAWCEMKWHDAHALGLTGFATVLARAVQAAEAMAAETGGGVPVKREGGGMG